MANENFMFTFFSLLKIKPGVYVEDWVGTLAEEGYNSTS